MEVEIFTLCDAATVDAAGKLNMGGRALDVNGLLAELEQRA